MPDLYLDFKVDADASGVEGAVVKIEDLEGKLGELKAGVNDLDKTKAKVELEFVSRDEVLIKRVTTGVQELTKAEQQYSAEVRKAIKPQQDSALATRQRLAFEKQMLSALTIGTDAYNKQKQIVDQASAAADRAKGIQEGSITTLRRANSEIQNRIANEKLSESQVQALTRTQVRNNEEVRRQLGYAKNSRASLQGQVQDYTRLRDSIDKGVNPKRWEVYNRKVVEANQKLSALRPTSEKLFDALNKFQTIRATIESVAIAFQALNSTINLFVQRQKQVEGFQLALQNVGLSTSEVDRQFKQAETTAKALGAPLASVEKSYKRMVPSLTAIGVSAEDSDKFIASLAARTQILGLNTEESGRLVEAFAQVLSKGRLTGEELNQQISELDGAFRTQLATAIGVSTSELTELVETGGIGANEFVAAFNKMQNGVQALEERVRNGNQTIQQLQNQLSTVNTKNIEALGKAFDPLIRAILNVQLQLAEFFNQLVENKQVRVLVKLVADLFEGMTALGSAVLNVIGPIVQLALNITGLITGLLTLEILPFSIANVIGVLAGALLVLNARLILTSRLAGVAGTALVNFAKKIGLAKVATTLFSGKLGIALKLIKGGEFGALAKGVGRFSKSLLPTVPQLQKAYNGLLSVAKGGFRAGKFLWANKSFIGFGAILAGLAVVAVRLGDGFLESGRKAELFNNVTKQTKQDTKALIAEFNKIKPVDFDAAGIKKTSDAYKQLVAATGPVGLIFQGIGVVFNFVKSTFGQLNQQFVNFKNNKGFIGIAEGSEKASQQINTLVRISNQYGGVLTKQSDLTKLDTKTLQVRAQALRKIIDAEKNQASVIETASNSLDKSIEGNKQRKAALDANAQALKNNAKVNREVLKAIEGELGARGALEDQVDNLAAAYEKANTEALKAESGAQLAGIQAQTQAYQDLANGVITAEQAQVSQAAAEVATLGTVIAAQNEAFQALQKRIDAGETLGKEDQKRYTELSTLIPQNAQKQAQAYAQVKQAITDAYESGIQKNQQLSDVAGQTAQRIASAFESISSSGGQFIQAGAALISSIYGYEKTLIDQNAKARLAAVEQSGLRGQQLEQAKAEIERDAENRKRQVLAQEISAKYNLINLETEIESIRIQTATRNKVLEAEIAQLRIRTEAAVARARGDYSLAGELDKAAGSYDKVIEAARIEGKLQQEVLGFRRDQQITALATEAATNGIATNFTIPNAQDTLNKINQLAGEAKNAAGEFSQISTGSFQAQKNIEKISLQKGQQEADNMRRYIADVGAQAQKAQSDIGKMATNMADVAKEAKNVYDNLVKITGLGRGNARAFGGPVAAGTEYFVNDGGGREAFLSRTGQLSMLPAGRNMKWVAPSSGMIIPANLVDSIKSRMNGQDYVQPVATGRPLTGRISGNLIGRASTSKTVTSASSTQRIINNVTIQSQEPVMDASKLMAQVARIKGRRRM